MRRSGYLKTVFSDFSINSDDLKAACTSDYVVRNKSAWRSGYLKTRLPSGWIALFGLPLRFWRNGQPAICRLSLALSRRRGLGCRIAGQFGQTGFAAYPMIGSSLHLLAAEACVAFGLLENCFP